MSTENTTDTIPANVSIDAPKSEALRRGAAAALELVQAFEITDAATFDIAAEELRAIATRKAALTEQRLNITRPLDGVKAAIMNLFRSPIDLLDEAEALWKRKVLAYQQAEQAKAREVQLAAERVAQDERNRINAEAAALAAAGNTGEAAVKEQVAQMVVATPVAAPPPPVARGISTRETVEYEITDFEALVRYVVTGETQPKPFAHPELLGLLGQGDTIKIRAYVKGLGMNCNLPGVRVHTKQSLSARKS